MTGAGDERNRLLTGGGAVGEARMAQVMDRPDVVGYLRRLQRRPELVDEPLVADPCATFGMAEDEVAVAPVDGALEVVGERVNEDRRKRDGALAFLATPVGWRMRQRLRRTFGRSAPSAG